jgi:Insertion element 4 transposase N-terminal
LLAQSVMLPCAPSTADALAVPALPGRPDLVMGLGVLTCEVTPGLVDEVIEEAACREKRRRLLPTRTVVYFVLGLCLFSGADSAGPPGYRSVMRWLTNGRRHVDDLVLPTSSALTRARQRLGSRPLELLFSRRRGDAGRVRVRAPAGSLGRDRPGHG